MGRANHVRPRVAPRCQILGQPTPVRGRVHSRPNRRLRVEHARVSCADGSWRPVGLPWLQRSHFSSTLGRRVREASVDAGDWPRGPDDHASVWCHRSPARWSERRVFPGGWHRRRGNDGNQCGTVVDCSLARFRVAEHARGAWRRPVRRHDGMPPGARPLRQRTWLCAVPPRHSVSLRRCLHQLHRWPFPIHIRCCTAALSPDVVQSSRGVRPSVVVLLRGVRWHEQALFNARHVIPTRTALPSALRRQVPASHARRTRSLRRRVPQRSPHACQRLGTTLTRAAACYCVLPGSIVPTAHSRWW